MTTMDLLIRLATAAALGGAIGVERHRADKAAGLRTHMLVCLGSALFMIVSAHGFGEVLRPSLVQLDPSRIAAQVVSGIGFLGAGAILRRNEAVMGLTTAANIWAVAAVGLATGGGMFAAAVSATVIMLVVLTFMKWVEDQIAVGTGLRVVSLLTDTPEATDRVLRSAFVESGVEVPSMRALPGDRPGTRRVEVMVVGQSDASLLALAAKLQTLEGVLEVSYEGRSA